MKSTIGKTSAFIGTILSAALATKYGTTLLGLDANISNVISGLLTNIGSEFVSPISEEILEQFKDRNPNKINHDIQKAIIESMKEAVIGVEILYNEQNPENPLSIKTKRFIKKFKNSFFDNFLPNQGYTISEEELKSYIFSEKIKNTYKTVEKAEQHTIFRATNDYLNTQLESNIIELQFRSYFIEKFIPLTQLYFTEKLKSNKYNSARIAMEKMLAEETISGINNIISRQEDLQSSIDLKNASSLSETKLGELKSLIKKLKSNNSLQILYSEVLDKRLEEIANQNKALKQDIDFIKTNLNKIHKTLSVNIRFAIALAFICIAISSILIYNNLSRPFEARIKLTQNNKVSPYYPSLSLDAEFNLILPNGRIETSIISKGTVYFREIKPSWKNRKVAIYITDRYWKSAVDSIILSEDINLEILPNETLSKVSGTIISHYTKDFIKNASVRFGDDFILTTNSNGVFRDTLPYTMLTKTYDLTIIAPGHEQKTLSYSPESPFPFVIQLEPIK